MNSCKCGCGQTCMKLFVHGHNRRKSDFLTKPRYNFIFCQCGECGQKVKNGVKFIRGHNQAGISSWNKDKQMPKETVEKNRLGHLGKKLGPCSQERKDKISAANLDRTRDPMSQITKDKLSIANKGKRSWRKGLTKEIDSRLRGKKQTPENIAKRMASSGKHKFPYIFPNGMVRKMRSNWEVIYACHLDSLNIAWQYEPKMFKLSTGKYYWPDFYLPDLNEWHEVKGFVWFGSTEKMDLFKKEYPNEKLLLITDISEYKEGA